MLRPRRLHKFGGGRVVSSICFCGSNDDTVATAVRPLHIIAAATSSSLENNVASLQKPSSVHWVCCKPPRRIKVLQSLNILIRDGK